MNCPLCGNEMQYNYTVNLYWCPNFDCVAVNFGAHSKSTWERLSEAIDDKFEKAMEEMKEDE